MAKKIKRSAKKSLFQVLELLMTLTHKRLNYSLLKAAMKENAVQYVPILSNQRKHRWKQQHPRPLTWSLCMAASLSFSSSRTSVFLLCRLWISLKNENKKNNSETVAMPLFTPLSPKIIHPFSPDDRHSSCTSCGHLSGADELCATSMFPLRPFSPRWPTIIHSSQRRFR